MSTINLLSTDEAAKFVGLSVQRIRQLCAAGVIGQRVGERWVLPEDELAQFKNIPRKRGPKPRQEKVKKRR